MSEDLNDIKKSIVLLIKENEKLNDNDIVLINNFNKLFESFLKVENELLGKVLIQDKKINSLIIQLNEIKLSIEDSAKFMDPVDVNKNKKPH